MYLEANNIAEAKQVCMFLSAMGKKTFSVLKDLLSLGRCVEEAL